MSVIKEVDFKEEDFILKFYDLIDQLIDLVENNLENYSMKGYVYLLETSEGYYKIGQTTKVKVRFRSIIFRKAIKLIETDDCIRLETYLHNMYAEKRVGQEIFKLSKEDVENIKSVKNVFYEGKSSEYLDLFNTDFDL